MPGNHPLEIISRRLCWVSDRAPPVSKSRTHTFCIDHVNINLGTLISSICQRLWPIRLRFNSQILYPFR